MAVFVTIFQARTSTRMEVAASMELARLLVSEAVALMQHEVPAENFLADLPSQLRLVRHVRILVNKATGSALATAAASEPASENRAPAWFVALIAPTIESRHVPVVVNGQRIGAVEIVAEPRDEIAEVWTDSVNLGAVALVLNVAVVAILFLLFGRVLDPLKGVARGLADLEQHRYLVRLRRPRGYELALIVDRFNALAQALEAVRAENTRLNHRLISAQDDERRRTALELHDEVGPSLFGLKANAGSIAVAVAQLPQPVGGKLAERARNMLGIIEHLQAINRSMLNRLRPMAIGHVPLADMLTQLVDDRARQQPQISFSFSTANVLKRSYSDSVDLTVYRCLQESLTNVIRHAQAKQVRVELSEIETCPASECDGRHLRLTVHDDGCGFDTAAPSGFGINGMQERVHGLGGRHMVDSGPGLGTCVRIAIPLCEPQDPG